MTLEELKKLYAEKGATERREETTEQGTQYYDVPVMLADGWTAWENQPQIIGYEGQGESATPIFETLDADKKLGGFATGVGDTTYYYDTTGKLVHAEKEDSFWDQFGPMIMAAATMGGGAGLLGNSLFGLSGTAASTAGGALLGAGNAALTDQDVLKGALLGGVGGAGGAEIGDTGFKVGDVTKAIKFAQNPSLAGAASYLPGLTSSLGGFDADPKDFTEGYFLPGGEGYIDPMSKTEGVSGPGYYDEITGQYIKDDLGGLQNPLGKDVGNLDPNQKWEYSLTRPGVWVNDKGEEIDLSYLPNTEKVMTGEEIMQKAGAMPKVSGQTAKKGSNVATPGSNIDLAALLSLLGKGGQQVVQAPSQDPYAHIKLMEELFGPNLDLTPAGENTAKRK